MVAEYEIFRASVYISSMFYVYVVCCIYDRYRCIWRDAAAFNHNAKMLIILLSGVKHCSRMAYTFVSLLCMRIFQ